MKFIKTNENLKYQIRTIQEHWKESINKLQSDYTTKILEEKIIKEKEAEINNLNSQIKLLNINIENKEVDLKQIKQKLQAKNKPNKIKRFFNKFRKNKL